MQIMACNKTCVLVLVQNAYRGGGWAGRGRGGRKGGPRPQPYNRNKFLQANFRFLVSDAADLRRHEADADLMLDWEDIVQVCAALIIKAAVPSSPVPEEHSQSLTDSGFP